ncbi:family 16 glycosylhydrolase [Gemmatimonas sp.]|jgi:beta-glucanase (GH16 family)|uniref:glycoside hydrolase family 16 protein n=1 Tax=Gemmatimonas sp. TaxID=1962908 RepID=UPI0037BF991F
MHERCSVRRRGALLRIAAVCVAAAGLSAAVAACDTRGNRFGTVATAAASMGNADRPGWTLTWYDEFTDTILNDGKWVAEEGNGFWNADSSAYVSGWGNDELQCYTASPANVRVRDGALRIIARRESVPNVSSRDRTDRCAYSSARLKTRAHDGRELFAQQYGRIEFRARLPEGQGLWPALWLLPLRDTYGTWAASGEIDVMEARGQNPQVVLGTLHYGGQWPNNVHTGMDYTLPNNGRISDWHVYAVEWSPKRIAWFVDDSLYQTQTDWYRGTDSTQKGRGTAPFDQPFYVVMNLAVGGRFLGAPDSTTKFPGEMQVDWVRAYEQQQQRKE